MKDPSYSCKENCGILLVKESDITKDEQEILQWFGGYLIPVMKAVKKFSDEEPFICKLKFCQVTSHPGLLSILEKNSGSLYIPDKNFLSLLIHIYGRVKQECSKNVKDIFFDALEDAISRSPRVLKFVEDLVGDLINNSKIFYNIMNHVFKLYIRVLALSFAKKKFESLFKGVRKNSCGFRASLHGKSK